MHFLQVVMQRLENNYTAKVTKTWAVWFSYGELENAAEHNARYREYVPSSEVIGLTLFAEREQLIYLTNSIDVCCWEQQTQERNQR